MLKDINKRSTNFIYELDLTTRRKDYFKNLGIISSYLLLLLSLSKHTLLKTITKEILEIIQDYRKDDGLNLDTNHIVKWVNQFEKQDRLFLLNEVNHILRKTYFSKEKIVACFIDFIKSQVERFKYKDEVSFLLNTYFISVQKKEKSQYQILQLFYQYITDNYGLKSQHIGSKSKKNVIYFDDTLATGNTLFREVREWLLNTSKKRKKYFELLIEEEFRLTIFNICCHTWGKVNVDYRIKQTFSEKVRKRVNYEASYIIENHPYSFLPKLNFVYPQNYNQPVIDNYFQSIDTGERSKYEQYAFRKPSTPKKEAFFSTPENRSKYEKIILLKGIEILSKVQNLKVKNLRPLGYTVKSHKTFGLGTQFFTYRNVSNTTPLVFWWEANGWYPLFPVSNRGKIKHHAK